MRQLINLKYIPIVLCAGFGSRLRPLTEFIPKVVCPLIDKPFAFYNIETLFKAGFEVVHCNTHYLSSVVEAELKAACEYFGYNPNRIRFWNEEVILETGGGISRIYHELCQENSENFSKDLIVCSGDIISHFPINEMISQWEARSKSELALMSTKNTNLLRSDLTYLDIENNYVLGFGAQFKLENPNLQLCSKIFTNHQIIHSSVVKNSFIKVNSSIDLFYRKILAEGYKILNFNFLDDYYWFNVGTAEEYLDCINYFNKIKNNYSNNEVNKCFYCPKALSEYILNYLNRNSMFSVNAKISEMNNLNIYISFKNNSIIQNTIISLNSILSKDKTSNVEFYLTE